MDLQLKEPGDRKNLQTMTAKMEEGFKSEQQARHLAQSEIMKGLKDEENARQMVQKDLEVLKEEMYSQQMGSGSIVCSESSTGVGLGGTFAWPQASASQFGDISSQERWNLKDGPRTTKSVVTRAHSHRGLEFQRCRINFTSTLTGIIPGQSKGLGRPRPFSIRGSRIWQR